MNKFTTLLVSVVLIGVGVLIGVFLPNILTDIDKPSIEFRGYRGLNEFTNEKVNRLRLEFRESMVVETININEGNCSINPFDVWIDGEIIEFPISVGMGTVIDGMTNCDLFVQLSIQTDKGLFEKRFPTD